MKKIIFSLIKIVLCTSLFIFSSCSDFWGPSKYIYLDDRFYYLKEYAEIDFCGYPGDGIWYRATPMIMPKIEEYYFDDNYITLKQKYHKKNCSRLLEMLLLTDYFGKIDTSVFSVYDSIMIYNFYEYYDIDRRTSRSEAFCDSVVNNNPYFTEMEKNDYNYYIIEKNDVVKHGPFSRKEFEVKFKEMNLSTELWIDDVPAKKRKKIFYKEFWISPKKTFNLGNHFMFFKEYMQISASGFAGNGIWYNETPIIMPKIVTYNFNKKYITIKQKYHKKNSSELLEMLLLSDYFGKINTSVFPVYDSIIVKKFKKHYNVESPRLLIESFCYNVVNTSPYFTEMEKNEYNYYIIEKHDVVKHGPLSRKEFELKFKEMNLTSELWIDDIPTKKRRKK